MTRCGNFFDLEFDAAKSTERMSYTFSSTVRLAYEFPFAGVMSERGDLFDVEFFAANGAKEMLAAFFETGRSEGNYPLFSRRMRQFSDSSFGRIAATRAYFASCFQTDGGAGSGSRIALDHIVTEFGNLFLFEYYAAYVANQTFITFSCASGLLNDFSEFVTVCGNDGILARDHVFTVVKLEIHIVIQIIIVFDIAVGSASFGDRFDLLYLARSKIIEGYRIDNTGTCATTLPKFEGSGVDVFYDDLPTIIPTIVVRRCLTFIRISALGIAIAPSNVEDGACDNGAVFAGNNNTATGINACAISR